MITLPISKTKDPNAKVRLGIIYAAPKQGKTTLFAACPDTLILDTQNGTKFYNAQAIQVKTPDDLRETLTALKEYYKENGKNLYKRIVFDVASDLLDNIVPELALREYQKSPLSIRKDSGIYNGPILDLPMGAGYKWVRESFENLYESFYPYCDTVILICHEKEIRKISGKPDAHPDDEDGALIPDLPGKMEKRNSGWAEFIGHMTRSQNQTIISFKSNGNVSRGSRMDYLAEKDIVIMESNAEGKITDIYLSRLFPDCKDIHYDVK